MAINENTYLSRQELTQETRKGTVNLDKEKDKVYGSGAAQSQAMQGNRMVQPPKDGMDEGLITNRPTSLQDRPLPSKQQWMQSTAPMDPTRDQDRPHSTKVPTKQQLMQSDSFVQTPVDQPPGTIHTPIDERPWWDRYNEAADPAYDKEPVDPSLPTADEGGEASRDPILDYMSSQITNPQLAEQAKQTYTPITQGEGEQQSIRQLQEREALETPEAIATAQGTAGSVGSVPGVTGSTIAPFERATAANVSVAELEAARQAEIAATGKVSPTTAARYEAAKAAQAEATKVANGTVTRLVDAVTGELSDEAMAKAAIQELDQVDPRSLVEAKTHEVPNAATVRGQLDTLLGDLEEGNIPAWAQPAVAQTEAMLASRGLSTSSVGKQALYNAIISSAMPIAQQDAKAKLSVFQQDITNEQQATLANAQFFQTLTAQNLSNKQQAALQNAATVAKMDLANADRQQQAQIENARNFLQMDIANLSAEQQANLLDSQNRQQQLLSNQSAENAAKQFNASSQQQADQFNANLASEMEKFNAQQSNAMAQFNTSQVNQRASEKAQLEQQAAIKEAELSTEVSQQTAALSAQQASQQAQLQQQAGIANMQTQAQLAQSQAQLDQQMSIANMQAAADAAKFNAQMEMQVSQFNAQLDFNRDQFNVQNATAIEQSNVQWRRQMNQLNTAGENAVNQANAMNAFNLSNQALTFMWQENRDRAKWAFEGGQNEEERKTRMAIAALGNEALKDAKTVSNITQLAKAAAALFDNWGG